MIPRETVQKVIDTADIVEVISEFVNLHKAGVNYKGLCPFHNEKTPSFVVSPSKQIYKCFGCGASGTAIGFIMEHEHLSYPEAIKWLARKYNIHIEEQELSAEEQAQLKIRESIDILNTFAQKHFTHNLYETEEGLSIGLSYFKNRGFSDQTIKKFQLGYSINKRNDLVETAIKKGYKPELLVKAGLAGEKENSSVFSNKQKYYDRFRGRVMFPIHSLSGKVIAFGGRILTNDKKTAKYLNSPETEVYHKSKSLYGIFFAKNEIVRQDKCYLVEGYTDVISMHQTGITNVVASSGTSLTEDQIRLIHRFTENLTLIFDGDAAGIKAGLRGLDMVLKQDMNVRIVALPQGEDPDSFAKKMPLSELKEFINTYETDFILFKIGLLKETELSDPIKKSKAIHNIISSIAVIPDQIKRINYIHETSNLLNIEEEIIFKEINKILEKKFEKNFKQKKQTLNTPQKNIKQKDIGIQDNSSIIELEIIELLLKFGNEIIEIQDEENGNPYKVTISEFIITELESENGFRNPVFQEILDIIKEQINSKQKIDEKILINHPNNEIRKICTKIYSKEYKISPFWKNNGEFVLMPDDKLKETVEKTILNYKLSLVKLFIKNITEEMKNPNLSATEIQKKMIASKKAKKIQLHIQQQLGGRNSFKI
jgi:DNA primase